MKLTNHPRIKAVSNLILSLLIIGTVGLGFWQTYEKGKLKKELQVKQRLLEEAQSKLKLAQENMDRANYAIDQLIIQMIKTVPFEWSVYTETQFATKFSIDYPKDWKFDIETSPNQPLSKKYSFTFIPSLGYFTPRVKMQITLEASFDRSDDSDLTQRESLAKGGVFRYIELNDTLRGLQMLTEGSEKYPGLVTIIMPKENQRGFTFHLSTPSVHKLGRNAQPTKRVLDEHFNEVAVYNHMLQTLRLLR